MRVVDLDAVIDRLEVEVGYEGMREDLYSLPVVDAVLVVRCRDCEYVRSTVSASTGERVGIWCARHDILNVGPDDFCSHGVRKNGENEKKPARSPGQAE